MIRQFLAVALAAASVSVPSVALAQRYVPPQGQLVDTQRIEHMAIEIQQDRYQLQQAEQNRDWAGVRRLRNQIQWREQRLQNMVTRSCR